MLDLMVGFNGIRVAQITRIRTCEMKFVLNQVKFPLRTSNRTIVPTILTKV